MPARRPAPAARLWRPKLDMTLGMVAIAAFFTLIVVIGRIGEVVPAMRELPLAKISLGLLVITVLLNREQLARQEFLRSPIALTALAFFALCAVSVGFSIWKSNSLAFLLSAVLVLALLFILMFKIVSSWRIARAALVTLCLCGTALAISALLIYDGARAEVDSTYDTNDLAYVLVTIMPIAVAFALGATGLKRWLFAAASLAMLMAALFTESRGGLLGLAAGMLTLFIWNPVRQRGVKRAPVSLLKRLVWIVIAVAALLGAWAQLPSSARERFATMLNIERDYNLTQKDVGRTFIWKRNMKAVVGRPIGFGLASSGALDGRLGGRYFTAHNSLVQVATELGFLGLFLFLRLYWLAWRQVSNMRYLPVRSDTEPRAISGADVPLVLHGLRSALVASFVAGFFLSQGYSYLLFTLFAIIAAILALQPAHANDQVALARPDRRARRPALPAGKR